MECYADLAKYLMNTLEVAQEKIKFYENLLTDIQEAVVNQQRIDERKDKSMRNLKEITNYYSPENIHDYILNRECHAKLNEFVKMDILDISECNMSFSDELALRILNWNTDFNSKTDTLNNIDDTVCHRKRKFESNGKDLCKKRTIVEKENQQSQISSIIDNQPQISSIIDNPPQMSSIIDNPSQMSSNLDDNPPQIFSNISEIDPLNQLQLHIPLIESHIPDVVPHIPESKPQISFNIEKRQSEEFIVQQSELSYNFSMPKELTAITTTIHPVDRLQQAIDSISMQYGPKDLLQEACDDIDIFDYRQSQQITEKLKDEIGK